MDRPEESTVQQRAGRGRGEDTRQALLAAARREFARKGLEGARVDEIAASAGVNKQLVYHYFGSKESLYRSVLEQAYFEIREKEQQLDLRHLQPTEAMRRLIEFSFDYLAEHPDFVALLRDENTHQGRHIDDGSTLVAMNRPIIELIAQTLRRGEEIGLFRAGLDPLQVYISIAGLANFYFANAYTLSRIFGLDLQDPHAVETRRRHVVDFALAAILVRSPSAS